MRAGKPRVGACVWSGGEGGGREGTFSSSVLGFSICTHTHTHTQNNQKLKAARARRVGHAALKGGKRTGVLVVQNCASVKIRQKRPKEENGRERQNKRGEGAHTQHAQNTRTHAHTRGRAPAGEQQQQRRARGETCQLGHGGGREGGQRRTTKKEEGQGGQNNRGGGGRGRGGGRGASGLNERSKQISSEGEEQTKRKKNTRPFPLVSIRGVRATGRTRTSAGWEGWGGQKELAIKKK